MTIIQHRCAFGEQLSKAVRFLEIRFSRRDESLQLRLKCGARSFLSTMKQLRSRVLWLFLVSRVLISAAVETIDEESSNDNLLSNDLEYLYKLNGQPVNYLNYRAVYGLRYIPTKKPIKAPPNNVEEFIAEKSTFNVTIPTQVNEVISTIENEDEEFASSDVESEIAVASTESAENLTPHNFTNEIVEPAVDESRNHVMRPNNRVEHALDFLAGRLKTLLYHSADPSRPESKISPPLSSLGKFLQLFNLIKFENIPCVTAHKPLRQLGGTCYTEVECLHLGGIAVDRCANGFGVCCVCEFYRFFLSAFKGA